MKVTVKADARHVPGRHRGQAAELVEERRLAFGRRWYRVRFADGHKQWVPAERVEGAARLERESLAETVGRGALRSAVDRLRTVQSQDSAE